MEIGILWTGSTRLSRKSRDSWSEESEIYWVDIASRMTQNSSYAIVLWTKSKLKSRNYASPLQMLYLLSSCPLLHYTFKIVVARNIDPLRREIRRTRPKGGRSDVGNAS
jgi:hypothetical protein